MVAVLIVGGGGREHALAEALAASPSVSTVWMTAHNAATVSLTRLAPIVDFHQLAAFCLEQAIDLVVIGPEAYLADGIVDVLQAAGVCVLGPCQRASRLESSKAYAKNFMRRYGIATTDFSVCDEMSSVQAWLRSHEPPYVIKADGLAAGKGVDICHDSESAERSAAAMLAGQYGAASKRLVLEDFAEGEEMSFIVLAQGQDAIALASSRDYKRLGDGDTGPNTGGMGVVSPAPTMEAQREAEIMRRIIQPALAGLEAEGSPFCGFLYAGLMINGSDIRVLEFNCRLGDPETQVILPRLQGDWYELLTAAASGQLAGVSLAWRESAVGVVLAAAGYPLVARQGDVISLPPTGRFYHAGTRLSERGEVLTSGGRVLTVVGMAASPEKARAQAYQQVSQIHFDGMQYRQDIGQ